LEGKMGKPPRIWENLGFGDLIIVICGTRSIGCKAPLYRVDHWAESAVEPDNFTEF
jgi:hypothetical protein